MCAYLALIATQNTITVYVAKDIKLKSTLFIISLIGGAVASITIFLLLYRFDISILILGMMLNKDHHEYISYFKNISSLTTIDIPNQPNAIKGTKLKDKLNKFPNIKYKNSIFEAIKSIPVSDNDIILITGSLYLAGEVLKLN